jgi:hypothetical protein
MRSHRALFAILGLCIGPAPTQVVSNAADDVATVRRAADGWRRELRIIDLHQHIDYTPERLVRAVQIMLDWVEQSLEKHPNLMADLAARIPEIGRHDAEKVRRLFVRYQDRILFATDFQVYNRLTLGSGGSGPPPTDDDALSFFQKHWRWLETNDRQFEHMTLIQRHRITRRRAA